jgi:hypothetical protein
VEIEKTTRINHLIFFMVFYFLRTTEKIQIELTLKQIQAKIKKAESFI